jgi:hypothetical protein
MAVPYTFANQIGNIALSELDANFSNVSAFSTTAGTVTNSAQLAINSVGKMLSLSVAGNVSTDTFFIGNGSQLTGVASGININNGLSSITIPISNGNIVTAINGANIVLTSATGQTVTGIISASGNITGANLLTGGRLSVTGNITGSDIITGVITSNIGAVNINLSTADKIFLNTANVYARIGESLLNPGEYGLFTTGFLGATTYIRSAGIISAVGNITGGNISVTGSISGGTGPFRLPNLTTTQRDNLTSANGDLIYNTTNNKIQGFENGAWANLV